MIHLVWCHPRSYLGLEPWPEVVDSRCPKQQAAKEAQLTSAKAQSLWEAGCAHLEGLVCSGQPWRAGEVAILLDEETAIRS